MTLQTLEYFIAVSQYRNFTKAAQACHVTQPALSRAIRGLEEELGCPLLIRSGRTAILTPEGEVCLTEAKRVLQQCEELTLRVREAGRQNQRPLRVGYVIVGHLNTFLQFWTEHTSQDIPSDMTTIYGSMPEIKQAFREGEIDVMLLSEPSAVDMAETERMLIAESGLYVILHKKNPLYERTGVTMAELRQEKFIMWDKETLPFLYVAVLQAFRQHGYDPHIVGEGEKMGDMLAQVAIHNGAGLITRAACATANVADYHCIPIEDSPKQYGLVCIWRKDNLSHQVAALKRALMVGEG